MNRSQFNSKGRRSKIKVIGWISLALLLGLMILWATLALTFTLPVNTLRIPIIVVYGLVSLLLPIVIRPRRYGIIGCLVLFFLVAGWFFMLAPSNMRDWQPDAAVLASAQINGDMVTVRNVRFCDYRSETDFTCRYYDKTVSLADLQTVDLFLVYWGVPSIAHTMLSFGFDDGSYICFSIETRKEKGEAYSTVKGFFRQYEQMYVVADERDVVRLRTNFRKEDVYLYRLEVSPTIVRKVFLDYLGAVNSLYNKPEWYNALTSNCTTSLRRHTVPYNPDAKFDWRLIVNGYLDELVYQRGFIVRNLPFVELKQKSYINPNAQAMPQEKNFSLRIRQGIPGIGL
ncbi:DUF4105 domain-containing protein [Desulfopila sp. IMCC35006]|uniref:Lnb N-terminal periplasmic domain-containing protein n=1 Tax=Desulfopila sp. IMCC35006 TaxID=2569542 RepID=UPI0010ACB781|nr:DUF4105 domain-containing protein [Desulfopila sp. IMCC35006]TKB28520.1 DUF4105 domain-containing protein [Desulfopila sp. IMCC35006]